MIGWIIGGLAGAAFGGILLNESLKKTADKVQNGDSVFVPPSSISLSSANPDPVSGAALKAFLDSFIAASIKVTGVIRGADGRATGVITGFPGGVSFPLSAVTSIDRNGSRIV